MLAAMDTSNTIITVNRTNLFIYIPVAKCRWSMPIKAEVTKIRIVVYSRRRKNQDMTHVNAYLRHRDILRIFQCLNARPE
jgi:hypothetical protein